MRRTKMHWAKRIALIGSAMALSGCLSRGDGAWESYVCHGYGELRMMAHGDGSLDVQLPGRFAPVVLRRVEAGDGVRYEGRDTRIDLTGHWRENMTLTRSGRPPVRCDMKVILT